MGAVTEWSQEEPGRNTPVFLHGMWRSGSTYYWSRFRAAPGTCCFYEPLHHGLARLTHRRIAAQAPETAAALRHPALERPYFDEYGPLIRRRGVRGYRPCLAYARFHLEAEEAHPALGRYLEGLLAHAGSRGLSPVLGLNRSGGRVAWLRRRFGGAHIQIEREPAAVWGSYAAEQALGNNAFFSMWLRVLEANQRHPLWAPLAERLRPRGPLARRLTGDRRAHERQIAAMGARETYLLVFYAWLVTAPRAIAASDLVIDDALLAESHHARRLEARIREITGVAVDLAALEVRPPRAALPEALRREVEAEAIALVPRGGPPARAARGASELGPRKRDLVSAVA